jgi:transposase InsO family protein
MPFMELGKDHQRRLLAHWVIEEQVPVSEAARRLGVTRQCAHLWVARARSEGIENLTERSRRPLQLRACIAFEDEERLLRLKLEFPQWGAKKLLALWNGQAPFCLRTADRILKRNGLVGSPSREPKADSRFERASPNELWQMDFKGVPKRLGFMPLSVLDDATRYCLSFLPMTDRTGSAVFSALWDLFGTYGLPGAILCDNGDCWGGVGRGPTWLESRLWLLGVATLHGRPRHPQTQGKVERFHRTAQLELGDLLFQEEEAEANRVFQAFVNRYNWIRPHEAISMSVPGAIYRPSSRVRPAKPPEHEIPEGCQKRKVDAAGEFCFKGAYYRGGRGLKGEYVAIAQDEFGPFVSFAGRKFAHLSELKV